MRKIWIFIFLLLLSNSAHATSSAADENPRPRIQQINQAVALVPEEYQKDVKYALKKAGRNAHSLIAAIEGTFPQERGGMAFLIANMPGRDLVSLKKDFLIEDVHLAYQVKNEMPWGKDIPNDIFLNNVLPYATINESRDNWRKDFYDRFKGIAQKSQTIDQAVAKLNTEAFEILKVSYNATKRKKPDQSPYESMKIHYASCTGLSVILTDALRSVGIPARMAGIPAWSDGSGNHTWVEIWDGSWHHIGANEVSELDNTWFTQKAAHTKVDKPEHHIYATSFKKTDLSFPMIWATQLRFVNGVDVTDEYTHLKSDTKA